MVKFRFRLNHPRASNLVRIYREKWRKLTDLVYSSSRNRETYVRLGRLRKVVPRSVTCSDVLEELSEVNISHSKLIADCSVLFDSSPYDLRIFILTILGYKRDI